MHEPSDKDVNVPLPPSRLNTQEALAESLINAYSFSRNASAIMRQHRATLLSLKTLTVATKVSALGLTASPTYVQAESQSMSTKIDAIITALNSIIDQIDAIKASATTNIKTL